MTKCAKCQFEYEPHHLWDGLCIQCLGKERDTLKADLKTEATHRRECQGELYNVRQELRAANEELAEYRVTFDLQRKRMGEATKLWQQATGKTEVLPDLGDLLKWLMDERASIASKFKPLVDAAFAMGEYCMTHPDQVRDVDDSIWEPFTREVDKTVRLLKIEKSS